VRGIGSTTRPFFGILLIAIALVPLFQCNRAESPHVVVYTALDEMYSRPILRRFEERTGIEVRAVYDTEASKTTGLVARLIAEQGRPRADVFWNNEVAQTIVLKEKGLIAPYRSPSAEGIPAAFKDPEAYWTGFAARARVIIYNTNLMSEPPRSIRDFLKQEWEGKAAIARPLFGTTATHAAALFVTWGDDTAKEFFHAVKQNKIAVLEGNATVRDRVCDGTYVWGLTDTDDANGAIADGRAARWLFPDQEDGGLGTLVIPNSVCLIKGAPNPDAAKKLVDYLLSDEVEAALANTRAIQIPLNPKVDAPENVPKLSEIRAMQVDFAAVAGRMETAAAFLRDEFLR
jgi:iron(III) transport system substrate-binding protein